MENLTAKQQERLMELDKGEGFVNVKKRGDGTLKKLGLVEISGGWVNLSFKGCLLTSGVIK